MIEKEEGVEPTITRTNALLTGFTTGHLTLWMGVNDNKLIGFFVTSKYVGGPVGSSILYLSYLCGMDKIPPSTWHKTMTLLRQHMADSGCDMLIATTDSEKIKNIAENFGATVDHRLVWRM